MEVLKDERLLVTTTIADGMGLRDYPSIKSKLRKDVYCFFFTGLFYSIMGHPGPERKKFLALVSGRTLEEANRILYGWATWRSWKNQDYDLIGRKTDYSLFDRTDMFLWYGGRGRVDKQKLLLETLRVLRKSGTFAIYDLMTPRCYGDMKAFLKRLKDMEYEKVELIDTTDGIFMSRKDNAHLMLSGTMLPAGRK